MTKQTALFNGARGAEYDDLAPFQDAYFPEEYRSGLDALFRAEGHLAATGRLKSDIACPYRAGGNELYVLPSLGPQMCLFDDQPVPLVLTCDCPRAHMLLNELGQRLPRCTKNRCPVRIVVLQHT